MKLLKILCACAMVLAMLVLPCCAIWDSEIGTAQAGATYYYTMNVGSTKFLTTQSNEAITSAFWDISDTSAIKIVSSNSVSCTIEVTGYSSSPVLVHCTYYYQELINGYIYNFSDYTDYYITISGSGSGGGSSSNTVKVTLNPNGGSVSPTSIMVDPNGTYGYLPTPTRSGYTFAGWYTAGTYNFPVESGYRVHYSWDHTVSARWRENITVTLDANGGSVSPSSLSLDPDGTYGSLPTPTRTGYTFLGWYTPSGNRVYSGDDLWDSYDHSLYAKWEVKNYTIYFNGNGATSGSMSSMNCTYGTSYTLPANAFKRTGYTFKGWATSSSATNAAYANKASVKNLTGSGSVTLYAVWDLTSKNLKDYTVTLSSTSYTYSGAIKVPAVTVKGGGKTLTEGTDYTVTYKNNINAGTATVVVTGKGAYTGSVSKTFTIAKATATASISKSSLQKGETAKISLSSSAGAVYTGYNSDVVYVSADGTVTALGAGSTTITATTYEDKNYAKSSIKLSVRVVNETGITWSVSSDGTILTIRGSGAMDDYYPFYGPPDTTYTPWHGYRDTVATVIIEDGITSIGSGSFYNFTTLKDITVPNSVKSIAYGAFWKCSSLEEIDLPDKMSYIGEAAFVDCPSLKSIDIPDGVSEIKKSTFSGCYSLKEIYLPASIKSIGQGAFWGCILETVYFKASPGQIKIAVNNYTTGNAPYNNAQKVYLYEEATLDSFSNIFTIPEGTVTIEMEAFAGITAEAVVIPDSCLVIGNRAFADCPNLKYVQIPTSVTHIAKDAFSGDVQIVRK